MGVLKKDHVLGAGAAALTGGVAGGALGALLGGPPGLAVGAAAGGALGAVLGDRASEAVDPRDDLGRFQQIFHTMPYYVSDMTWEDYAPAYRHGIEQYHARPARTFVTAEPALEQAWDSVRGSSRLVWSEAREAIAHVWRWYDEELHKTEHLPPPR